MKQEDVEISGQRRIDILADFSGFFRVLYRTLTLALRDFNEYFAGIQRMPYRDLTVALRSITYLTGSFF